MSVLSQPSLPPTSKDGMSDQLSWARAPPIPSRQNRNMRNPKRLKEGQQTTRGQLRATPWELDAFDQYMGLKMVFEGWDIEDFESRSLMRNSVKLV